MTISLGLEDGRTMCERCVLADTALARMRGLLGRSDLAPGEGIFLRPAGSVHTAFMRFPIDVAFLDRDNRVVKIAPALAPWRTAAARGAKAAVELRAGECARRDVKVGDRVLEPEAVRNHRRTGGLKRFATNATLAVIWLLFAAANLMQWAKTHHPVGLGAMLLELLTAALFFARRDPWITSRAPLAWLATAIGTWGLLASRPHYHPLFGLEGLYFGLQLGGALAAACSLGFLGRSFGLVAANRGVRTSGPYRIVRHPLYMSYFFAQVGYTLENPAVRNAILLVIVLSFQLVRIRTEEDCLRRDPSYASYCERVRYRLVPGFW